MKNTAYSAMALAILLSCHSAFGQFSPMVSTGSDISQSTRAKFKDGSDNKVEIQQYSANLNYIHPFEGGSSLLMGLKTTRSKYDFAQPMPWKDVNDLNAFLMTEIATQSSWSAVGLGMVRSAYDSKARFKDGFGWGVGAGARYQASDSLSWLVGLGYFTRLEGSNVVVPIVGVEWQISERLSLEGILGLELKYDLFGDGRGILAIGMDYHFTDFALQKDPLTGHESAIRPEGMAASLSYTHNFTEKVSFRVFMSSYGEQEYRTFSDGKRIDSFKTDAFLFYGVGFNVMF